MATNELYLKLQYNGSNINVGTIQIDYSITNSSITFNTIKFIRNNTAETYGISENYLLQTADNTYIRLIKDGTITNEQEFYKSFNGGENNGGTIDITFENLNGSYTVRFCTSTDNDHFWLLDDDSRRYFTAPDWENQITFSGGSSGGGGNSGGGDDEEHTIITGNIKQNEIITATDVANLKAAIIDIYNNRNYLEEADLKKITLNSPGFGNTSISTNNYINQNFYYILNSILQLNDINNEIVKNNQYDFIITNAAPFGNKDLLELIADWETTDPKKIQPSKSCRGGCVGFCYGCTQDCSYACTASSDSQGNIGGIYEGYNPCKEQCMEACWVSCNSYCYKGCNLGCSGCKGSCSGSCKGGCNGQGTGIS